MSDSMLAVEVGETLNVSTTLIDKGDNESGEYNDQTVFDRAVRVPASTTQYIPNEDLKSILNPNEGDFNKLVEEAKEVDSLIRIKAINDSTKFDIHAITTDYVVFKNADVEGDQFFHMYTPSSNHIFSTAYRQFCKLIGVPHAYAKKNPPSLNRRNFNHWLSSLKRKNPEVEHLPVDVVYYDQTVEVTWEEGVEDNKVTQKAQSSPIFTFTKRNVQNDQDQVYVPVVTDSVPFLSKILVNLRDRIKAVDPEITVGLQSYSVGYDGRNKGQHFARLILEHPDFNVEAGGETFSIGFNLHMDFIGDGKNSDQIQIAFVNFRQICTNGMVQTFDDAQISEWKDNIMAVEMDKTEHEKGSPKWEESFNRMEKNFNKVLNKDGINIPVWVANDSLDVPLLKPILTFCLSDVSKFANRLDRLYRKFPEHISEKAFIEALLDKSRAIEFSSPKLIQSLCREYIAGNILNKQKFNTPMDIVNYLTFLARSFSTDEMNAIEQKSMELGEVLMNRFIDNTEDVVETKYERLFRQTRQELIPS